MPPANSPVAQTPAPDPLRPHSPFSFGSAIQQLAAPVPDLAATLTVAADEDDEVHDANVDILRLPLDDEDAGDPYRMDVDTPVQALEPDARPGAVPDNDPLPQLVDGEPPRDPASDSRRRQQAQMREQILAHRAQLLRQRQESLTAWAERMSSRAPAYTDRIPQQQSLYDWAPGAGAGGANGGGAVAPSAVDQERRAEAREAREARDRPDASTDWPHRPNAQEPSLRSAAILQSVSRNWRFSDRSRALMTRYIVDREQRSGEARGEARSEVRGEQRGEARNDPAPAPIPGDAPADAAHDAWMRVHRLGSPLPRLGDRLGDRLGERRDAATIESLRRRYLENPATKVTEFERIIKYLHRLRTAEAPASEADVPSSAAPSPSLSLRSDRDNDRRVARRIHRHARPHFTSWLTPGMSFAGHQQAAPVGSSATTLRSLAQEHAGFAANGAAAAALPSSRPWPAPGTLAPTEPWLGSGMTATPEPASPNPAQAQAARTTSAPASPAADTWTVKVALHAVDWDDMTLQGTMEAFNVPSFTAAGVPVPASGNKTTFSTYLEGELIDFANHTLLTEADRHFAQKTTSDVDAAYWRKLEPFARLADDEIARCLLDRAWLERELMAKYVLMRWKERCFVRPTFTTFSHGPAQAAAQAASAQTAPAQTAPPAQQPRQHHSPPLPALSSTTSFLAGADGHGYGLSISGFYYVSLERATGRCMGLYFDPQSSPYQRLELAPVAPALHGKGPRSGGAGGAEIRDPLRDRRGLGLGGGGVWTMGASEPR